MGRRSEKNSKRRGTGERFSVLRNLTLEIKGNVVEKREGSRRGRFNSRIRLPPENPPQYDGGSVISKGTRNSKRGGRYDWFKKALKGGS